MRSFHLPTLALAAALPFVLAFAPVQAKADPVSDFNNFIANATTFTEADLSAALADAQAHNDAAAAQCYAGTLAYVQAHPVSLPPVSSPVGAVSAFQIARDGVKLAEANAGVPQVPDAINQACGYLALDVQKDVAKAATGFTILGIKL